MHDRSKSLEDEILTESDSSTLLQELADGQKPSDSPDGPKRERFGREAARANPSRARGKAKVSKTSDTSGLISFGSSPSAALQQSLENRLRARLGEFGSLEYELTWKHWDTESDAPICALRASARRTSGKGFTGWPTATQTDARRNGQLDSEAPNKTLNHTTQTVGWPTTCAQDGPHGGPAQGTDRLPAAALAGWATPSVFLAAGDAEKVRRRRRQECKERTGNGNGFGMNLEQQTQAVAGWPTVTVRDQKNVGLPESAMARKEAGHAQPLNETAQLAGWPTTTTRDSKSEGKDGPNRTGAPSLPALVMDVVGWATAGATDDQQGRMSREAALRNKSNYKSLSRDVLAVPGMILGLYLVPTGRRVVLAPEFSLWLMGFPESWQRAAPNYAAWLARQVALELEFSKDLETQSVPSSPPNS